MSRAASFSAFLAAHPGTVLVHWPGPHEPAALRALPRLGATACADLVVTSDPAALETAITPQPVTRKPGSRPKSRMALREALHDVFGDFEIGVHTLHVVIVLKHVEQL